MKKLLLLCLLPMLCMAETKELFWEDLVPKDYVQPEQQVDHNANSSNGQQSQHAPVVAEYNGLEVRIPGFVVPLEGDENSLTEFLLVPYFGACIHVPPPPANQIVHVTFAKGIKIENLYDPIWIVGTLSTQQWSGDIATVGYSLAGTDVLPYDG
ncbi:DUF3299 domain-containing protein [Neptunicella sp. SCSIO 80796]|uniref:DUF3299 domain-containing protein n=1 Tax=Neptunicella plasticusilytica TaxID=3117012 RepID=UPI003A4D52BF